MTWLVIAAAVLLLVGVAYWWRNRPQKLPDAWPLTTRKVFTKQEHEAYALMRSAFPDQAVLVKLPLSRFLQLTDTKNMKYWFGLLTPLYVTFAVCRVDGKVLSVIDFDSAKQRGSRSGYTLKRRAFDACKLQYLRFDYESMPNAKVLRMSVLGDKAPDLQVAAGVVDSAIAAAEAGPASKQAVRKVKDAETAAREAEQVRAQLEQIVKDRRHDRESRDSRGDAWAADSILGRDSFLRPDSRIDAQVDVDIR